jgi:hypothetical protein
MSFNSYTIKVKIIGGGNVVWRKVNAVLQSGVSIPGSKLGGAKIIPAGTPVAYSAPGGECVIIDNSDAFNTYSKKPTGWNLGFILNDVVIEAFIDSENELSGTYYATASVVIGGELYVERVNNDWAISIGELCPNITMLFDTQATTPPES